MYCIWTGFNEKERYCELNNTFTFILEYYSLYYKQRQGSMRKATTFLLMESKTTKNEFRFLSLFFFERSNYASI